jgi:hypothetical protein
LEKIASDFFATAPAFPPAKSVVFAGCLSSVETPGPAAAQDD